MSRNAIRIVCNPGTAKISYFFRNELGEWRMLSGSSPLSRQHYTNTTIKERCEEIVSVIDEIYNRNNKGVDIFFEGTTADFNCLSAAVEKAVSLQSDSKSRRDICCTSKYTKIAVVGKPGVGKSFLIEALLSSSKIDYSKKQAKEYTKYTDEIHHTQWFELKGIDFQPGTLDKAFLSIKNLVGQDLTTVIYCISGDVGRIDEAEKEFIIKLDSSLPSIKVITVLTKCYKDDVREKVDEIEKIANHVVVFPTLAQNYTIKRSIGKNQSVSGVVQAFGLKELSAYIFEGRILPHAYPSSSTLADNRYNENRSQVAASDLASAKQIIQEKTPTAEGSSSRKELDSQGVTPKSKGHSSKESTPEKKAGQIGVAVIGKSGSGKTCLIEQLGKYHDSILIKEDYDNYIAYESTNGNENYYEVAGIDLGRDSLKVTFTTVKSLVSEGVNTILYCVSGGAGRIERLEQNFIRRLVETFPKNEVVIVLTMCYKDDVDKTVDALREISSTLTVVPTLAMPYKTSLRDPKTNSHILVEPFGLDTLTGYLQKGSGR